MDDARDGSADCGRVGRVWHPDDLATRATLPEMTRAALRHRLATGRWQEVVAGVVLTSSRTITAEDRTYAARMAWPEGTVALRTAAAFWRLPVADDGPVPVVTTRRYRPARGLTPLRWVLAPSETFGRGLVTTPERTVIDCLAHLPWGDAERLWAWSSSRGQVSAAALEVAVTTRAGSPGVRQLRRVLVLARSGAVNGAETRLHAVLRRAGLQGWEAGAAVTDRRGRVVARGDVVFRDARLVLELDGEQAHRGSFQADRTRQNRLVDLGYRVLRFTWTDVRDRPDDVVRLVRAALARAA